MIAAVVGGITLYLASILGMPEFSRPTFEREIQQLRSLKTSDVSQLAELLDHSAVQIPSGDFIMGSNSGRDDESPQHSVYLDAYEIDRYEVTNIQYQRFLRATGRMAPQYWMGNDYPLGQTDSPIVGVPWDDADAYCRWAGKRLPTEAEWEKACRGTDGHIYPWGNTWDSHRANVDVSPVILNNGEYGTLWDAAWHLLQATPTGPGIPNLQPIGSHPDGASPYGIMDMVGSASEWVADWYNWSDYSHMPAQNPIGLGPPWNHCVRGSPWYDPVGNAEWIQNMSRCSARSSSHEVSDPRVGFRCVRSMSRSTP